MSRAGVLPLARVRCVASWVRSQRLRLLIESSAAGRTRWCGAGARVATTERTERATMGAPRRARWLLPPTQPTPQPETRPASALALNTLTTSTLGTFGLGRDGGHVTPADYFSRSARVPPDTIYFSSALRPWEFLSARGTFSRCTHTLSVFARTLQLRKEGDS
jgi:hypothetical protein